MAVAEFQTQWYDNDDMASFSDTCGLENAVTVDKNIGGNSEDKCKHGLESCVESLLDIEYIKAVGGAIPLDVRSERATRARSKTRSEAMILCTLGANRVLTSKASGEATRVMKTASRCSLNNV